MLQSQATAALGEFFAQLTSLEPEPDSDSGLCVKLPPPVMVLPRKQRIPVETPLTRFEQFAKKKGLKIKKKEKKVFDETTGEWRLSYGYIRGGKPQDGWMIEAPDAIETDPFAQRDAKQEALAKQKKREGRNKKRAARAVAAVASVSAKRISVTDILREIQGASSPGSSASMGQFDAVPNKPLFESPRYCEGCLLRDQRRESLEDCLGLL
jgi:regulator of ribosome biosynthesis